MIDHPCFRFFDISHIRKEDVLTPSLKGCLSSVFHVPRNGLASPYGFSPINMCPVPCWVSVNDNNRNIFYLAFLSTLISLTVVNFLVYVSSRDYFQIPEKTWGLAFLDPSGSHPFSIIKNRCILEEYPSILLGENSGKLQGLPVFG